MSLIFLKDLLILPDRKKNSKYNVKERPTGKLGKVPREGQRHLCSLPLSVYVHMFTHVHEHASIWVRGIRSRVGYQR